MAPDARIGSKDAFQAVSDGGGPVRGVRQRLAEPCHIEQGVVGGGADYQDRQNALALAVELDPAELRHAEHQQDGRTQGEHRGQQHGHGQEQGPVDHQEDDQHRPQRHEQQDAVDAGEGAREVGRQPGRASDKCLRAFRRSGPDRVPQLLHGVLDLAGRGNGHDELHRPLVLGGDGADDRTGRRQRFQLTLEGRRLAQLGRRERGLAFNHDDGGNLARVPELFLPIPGLGGFRAGRQEGRLVVGRDLLQPAEGGPANARDG